MTSPIQSTVLQATTHPFFNVKEPWSYHSVLQPVEKFVRITSSSFVIPIAGVSGAIWHLGRAIACQNERGDRNAHLGCSFTDFRYALSYAPLALLYSLCGLTLAAGMKQTPVVSVIYDCTCCFALYKISKFMEKKLSQLAEDRECACKNA